MHAQQFLVVTALLISAHTVLLSNSMGIVVPGTNWCGPGNIADDYNDLGTEMKLDMCCRAHDHCEEKISPGEERYGLSNDNLFPIFSCDCEAAFRKCLTSLHSFESAALGRIYYSSTQKCFIYDYPIGSCEEHQWDTFLSRCISYTLDESKPKQWQLHDLAFYTHISDP